MLKFFGSSLYVLLRPLCWFSKTFQNLFVTFVMLRVSNKRNLLYNGKVLLYLPNKMYKAFMKESGVCLSFGQLKYLIQDHVKAQHTRFSTPHGETCDRLSSSQAQVYI